LILIEKHNFKVIRAAHARCVPEINSTGAPASGKRGAAMAKPDRTESLSWALVGVVLGCAATIRATLYDIL
jgi:hypothetical protein